MAKINNGEYGDYETRCDCGGECNACWEVAEAIRGEIYADIDGMIANEVARQIEQARPMIIASTDVEPF